MIYGNPLIIILLYGYHICSLIAQKLQVPCIVSSFKSGEFAWSFRLVKKKKSVYLPE